MSFFASCFYALSLFIFFLYRYNEMEKNGNYDPAKEKENDAARQAYRKQQSDEAADEHRGNK